MARTPTTFHGHRLLPFRIPFFRIFYSTTYTTLYAIAICLLAITPASIIYTAIESNAYQYIFMIGGVYVLTAITVIFIYSSRLYTNRTVLAGVGKAYIPIEEGEVGRKVRKMIAAQLERSAIVAWESRPRDLEGEIMEAEQQGLLPPDSMSVTHNDYTLGRIISVDPARPPWGRVQHPGWTSPSHRDDNANPGVECSSVIAELPNLIEAQAVSLAPPDPMMTPKDGQAMADSAVVEALRRQEGTGVREYLTQLSYLGLVNPPDIGQSFIRQYEQARFCGRPPSESEFQNLMATFSELLSGMTELNPEIIDQIRAQTAEQGLASEKSSLAPSQTGSTIHHYATPSPPQPQHSPNSSPFSPVTAREAISPDFARYLPRQQVESTESLSSVVHHAPYAEPESPEPVQSSSSLESASMVSFPSDAGSVVWHGAGEEHG